MTVCEKGLEAVASFLKERDEALLQGEADDAERLESAQAIITAYEAAKTAEGAVAWRNLADKAVRALTLATEDRSAGDTVEMNVGDLSVMLGLLSAPQAPYPARHVEPTPLL